MSKVRVLELRPTQFAVGMREVEVKTEKLSQFKGSELEEYISAHRVPVVVAPDQSYYLIDHHHLVRAAWEIDIQTVKIDIVRDFSHETLAHFWDELQKERWVYLHDQFGKGPHPPELLPLDVRGLADDPFRSLAWAVREHRGFEKSPIPFCEFKWAEFFRKHISGHPLRGGFHAALKHALELSHNPEAKTLPGYIEKN